MKTLLYDVTFSDEGSEVVDLAYVKSFSAITTTTHDALLTNLIKSCRAEIEKVAGISIIERTITAEWYSVNEECSLPYPIINSITSVESDGTALTANVGYKVIGTSKKTIIGTFPRGLKVIYTAGYGANCPDDLKLCIAKAVLEIFENRTGISVENSNLLPNSWRSVAINYRPTWLIF